MSEGDQMPESVTECMAHADDPAAWFAQDFDGNDEWIYRFTHADLNELTLAATHSASVPLVELRAGDFPLNGLAVTLAKLRREILQGRGFVLLRGLPVGEWSPALTARIYCGIGCYIGQAVSQNAAGHLLGHVKDLGKDPSDPVTRVYQTNYRQPFHTDSTDIVGLLCIKTARRGGASAIASSTSAFNVLAEQRPDLLEVLCQPFYVDRKDEIPPGKEPTYQLAVFHRYAGYVTCIYSRDFIEAAQRFDHVPRLLPEQIEAMDLLDKLVASDRLRFDMVFEPGDIQLLHNHQILHSRTTYEDWPEIERRRHLLRLWLSTADGRPLPMAFEERYGPITPGMIRGGIRVSGAVLNAPIEP